MTVDKRAQLKESRFNSAYLRMKQSVVLTAETRGVPYKVISWFLAIGYICFGIRNVFFCGALLPVGAGEAIVMDMWQGCKDDPTMEVWEGMHGLGDWLIAIVRLSMINSTKTADLFHTMLILGFYSVGFFVGALRVNITDLAFYYTAFMSFGLLYENYVLYLAYLAHRSRRHARSVLNNTQGIPGKPLLLVLSIAWAVFALKNFVACDSPFLAMDTPEERNFWSTWKGCRNPDIHPNMRVGWAHMSAVHAVILAGIRAFAYWTPNLKAFVQATSLLNFYNIGCLFLLLRAGLDAIPMFPYLSVFLVGLVYEAYALATAATGSFGDK